MRTLALLFAFGLGACKDEPSPAGGGGTDDTDDTGSTTDDTGSTTDDTGSTTDDTATDLVHVDEEDGCDSLNTLHCLLPWPSDRFVVEDASTATGYRLANDAAVVPRSSTASDETFDTEPYERLDGVSPATQMLTMFPVPPDLSSAAFHDSVDRSLAADSPTLLLDLTTGELLPHWVELDVHADGEDETLVYLRLTERLEEGHAYAVGYRGLDDVHGEPLRSGDAFLALRDGLPTDSPVLEARRASYETMFAAFEAAGVGRAELQAAWWFPVASGAAIRGDILAMRADALERLGEGGIGCTVSSVEDDYEHGGVASFRVIKGTYTVPSYMDSPEPPARMVRDEDGNPLHYEDAEVDFTVVVPYSVGATGEPAPLVTFGHGLMGTGAGAVTDDWLRASVEETPAVLVATDWAGMSTPDVATVASAFLDANRFPYVTERLQQGMINQIALTRTFAGVCSTIDELVVDGHSVIDSARLYYAGGSQGGIYGGTLLTLSPDMPRGVLFVNGAIWPFTIERSIDFVPYEPYFEAAYASRVDRVLLLSMAQHLWDATDPASYLPFTTAGLPELVAAGEDTGKEVLSLCAHNDAQVPNLSSDVAMRMAGVPVIEGSSREPWGFDVVQAPYEGSAYITFDLGDRDVPEGNEAPSTNDGGHYTIGQVDSVKAVYAGYLLDGTVTMPCDGVCDPD